MFEVLNVNTEDVNTVYFETQFVGSSRIGRVNGGSGRVRNLTGRIGSHQKSLSWGSGGLWLGATKMNSSLEMACFGEYWAVLWQNRGTVYISEFWGTCPPVHRYLRPCKVSRHVPNDRIKPSAVAEILAADVWNLYSLAEKTTDCCRVSRSTVFHFHWILVILVILLL